MSIDITVNQEDIDSAVRGVCPITKALERAGYTADVLYGRIRTYGESVVIYWVPEFVTNKMKIWDSDKFMEPFEFTAVRY